MLWLVGNIVADPSGVQEFLDAGGALSLARVLDRLIEEAIDDAHLQGLDAIAALAQYPVGASALRAAGATSAVLRCLASAHTVRALATTECACRALVLLVTVSFEWNDAASVGLLVVELPDVGAAQDLADLLLASLPSRRLDQAEQGQSRIAIEAGPVPTAVVYSQAPAASNILSESTRSSLPERADATREHLLDSLNEVVKRFYWA